MSKKYTIDGKPRKSGVGKLFLGIFLGFIMCLGTLFGLGWFAYNNLSAQWINDTFNANVDLGSKDLNKKTIKDFVSSAISLSQNIDTYTLNDIKKDFGFSLGDELMGLNIEDLKDVPVKELGEAMQDKLSNISADELDGVLNLDDMNLILNKTNTYYVSGNTLYEDEYHNVAVNKDEINYEIYDEASKTYVKIKDEKREVKNGKADFELRFLPLTKALGDFMNTMGDKITVGELVDTENGFGVSLPAYLHDTAAKREKTINELESVVNNLYLADFLGYKISGSTVMNGTTEVTGIVAKLAKKTVTELKGVETIIKTSTVAEVFDYSYESGKYYYMNQGVKTEVTGIMKVLATTQIQELTKEIGDLTVLKALDYSVYTKADGTKGYKDSKGVEVTGAITLVDLTTTPITQIASKLQDAIDGKTISQLAAAGVITVSAEDLEKSLDVAGEEYIGLTLGELYIGQAIEVLIALL